MKIIYHANCTDGFCAAWILHKVYPNAEFIPCQYGGQADSFNLDTCRGHDVIIADFSFRRDKMLALNEVAHSVTCFDHHKTAQADLAGLDFCVFDMDKSGARLVWESDFGDLVVLQEKSELEVLKIKTLVEVTEDRDLWRWKLPCSREYNAAIRSYPMTFEAWDRMIIGNLYAEGAGILRYQRREIEGALKTAHKMKIGDFVVPVVNNMSLITSEILNELAANEPFAAAFVISGNMVKFSLRSESGGVDVSEVALAYGGGGHKHAAGFSVPIDAFLKMLKS